MEWRSVGPGPNMDIDWGETVPQDVIDTVEAVFEDMIGGWTPFVGPIEDSDGNIVLAEGEVLTVYPDQWYGMDWFVKGVTQVEE